MATLTDAEKRVGVMTHELGHTLGFGHHWEPLPLGPCTTTSDGAPQASVMHASPCGSATVQHYDRTAFKVGYSPAKVTSIAVTNASTAGRVLISWDGSNVHVERGFEVQVKVRYGPPLDSVGWLRVTTVPANEESAEFAKPIAGAGYSVLTQAATTSAAGSYGTYRVISLSDALATTDPTSVSEEMNHVQPRLVVTYTSVCVEWGWYLSWRNTVLDEVRTLSVPGYATAAAARAVLEASATLIGSGGGVAPPFPILSQRVFCSRYVSVPVGRSSSGTGETTSSASTRGTGATTSPASTDTLSEPVSGGSALSPVQQVDAALATLSACVSDITTLARKSTCVSAFADAVDAIAAADGSDE